MTGKQQKSVLIIGSAANPLPDLSNYQYFATINSPECYNNLRQKLLDERFDEIIICDFSRKTAQVLDAVTTYFSGIKIFFTTVDNMPRTLLRPARSHIFYERAAAINQPLTFLHLFTYINKKLGQITPLELDSLLLGDTNNQFPKPISLPAPKNTNSRPTLSIGIPCYNVEKYIQNTLATFMGHPDLGDIEIIVVNDGSSDNTMKMVDQMQLEAISKHFRPLKIIDKENGGHGSTINTAIEHATGKYFRLLDGDDYFSLPELVKLMSKLRRASADIVLTDYVEDIADPLQLQPIKNYARLTPGKKYDLSMPSTGNLFAIRGPLLSTSTCRTSLLKEPPLNIDEKSFYVDMEYNYAVYTRSQTVEYQPLDLYMYYIGRQGQSMSKDSMKRNWRDHEKVTARLLADYHNDDLASAKKDFIKKNYINVLCMTHYMIALEYTRSRKVFRSFDRILKKYPEIYSSPIIASNVIKLHRLTGGFIIWLNPLLYWIRHRKAADS